MIFRFILHFSFADNVRQISSVPVHVQILDINDHAPEFSEHYESYVCENAGPGQVRVHNIALKFKQCSIFSCVMNICVIYIYIYSNLYSV